MAFEADRVVVELIAKVDQFDTPVKTSAQSFDSSMNRISASATKAEQAVQRSSANRAKALERESAQIGQFSRLLGNQLNDVGALLTSARSPFVAPVREAPKVSRAFGLVQAGAVAMGGVLGGIAVQGAFALVDALGNLILKAGGASAEIKGLVEKLKEAAEKKQRASEAAEIYANTLEGVEEAIRANAEALKNLNDEEKTAARLLLEAAVASNIRAKAARDEAQALVESARARLENNRAILAGVSSPEAREFASQDISAASAALDKLESRLKRADTAIENSGRQIQEALSQRVVEMADSSADPLERIRQKYEGRNGLIEQARQRAIAEGTVTKELRKQIDALKAQQKAEEDRERAKQRRTRSTRENNNETGRQISEADARRIVAGIGGTVTSGRRSPEHNERVGGQANSFHLSGQAVDIAKGAGITIAKIRAAFTKVGVRLTELLDEGDHFHAAWGRKGRTGPSADTLAKRALATADAAERREQAFQNEKATLDDQVIDARQALVTSAEQIAELELQAIEISRQKYADNVASLVSQRKLQGDEAIEVLKLNDERAKLRAELVQRREAERKFRMRMAEIERQNAVKAGGLQAQQDLLQSQEGIARTQRERLEIGRRLVDLQFQEERLALQAAIAREAMLRAQYARTKSQETLALLEQAEVDAAIARQRLGTIDQRQGAASQGNAEANASPLQSYFGDIQAEADDINTAFERIAAGGLQNFTDRLTDAIVNFRSLGDVGRAVLAGITADLVRLAIRLILNATIGKIVQSGAAAAAAAGGAAVAAAWAPAAAAVSLATFGANAGPASAAIIGTNALAMGFAQAGAAGGFREGGRISGPGTSTSDSIPIRASANEYMVKARSAQRVGYDALDYINRTGELPRYTTDADAPRIRPTNAEARRAGGGSSGFSDRDIATLRGIIGEAVTAMPDVQNYIGFDPDALVAKALGSQATVNRLIEVLGQNSTKAKAALN